MVFNCCKINTSHHPIRAEKSKQSPFLPPAALRGLASFDLGGDCSVKTPRLPLRGDSATLEDSHDCFNWTTKPAASGFIITTNEKPSIMKSYSLYTKASFLARQLTRRGPSPLNHRARACRRQQKFQGNCN